MPVLISLESVGGLVSQKQRFQCCLHVYEYIPFSGASVMILLANYRQTDTRIPHLRHKIRKHHDTRLEELGAAGFSQNRRMTYFCMYFQLFIPMKISAHLTLFPSVEYFPFFSAFMPVSS